MLMRLLAPGDRNNLLGQVGTPRFVGKWKTRLVPCLAHLVALHGKWKTLIVPAVIPLLTSLFGLVERTEHQLRFLRDENHASHNTFRCLPLLNADGFF